VEPRLFVARVELAEVDDKLIGIVADLDMVGIPPFGRSDFLNAVDLLFHKTFAVPEVNTDAAAGLI
jgi:hypothetical protein